MAIYYINGNNSTGTFPYDFPSNGAPNFSTLFANISTIINDGDSIRITGGAIVDDSLADINIMYMLTITGEDSSPVLLKNDGVGFNVAIDGVTFTNVSFKKANFTDNTMITCSGNNLRIRGCTFDYDDSSKGSVINMTDSNGFEISNNYINVPAGTPFSYGIYITGGGYGIIDDNIIDMNNNNGQAITINDVCNTIIHKNLIGDFDSTTTNNAAINVNGVCDHNKVTYNVIGIAGSNSFGIVLNPGDSGFKNTVISNNLMAIRENDFGSGGLFISYNSDNTESYFEVINNIISFRPDVSPTPTYNDSVAINASIQRGIIDFNDIYGFDDLSIFVNNGAPDVITEIGDRNIFVDPRTNWTEDVNKYPKDDIRRYYCTTKSECIGAGYQHHNIGAGVDGLLAIDDNYVNIVDTVTSGVSDLEGYSYTYVTFFNDLIMEDPDKFNTIFRDGNGPYPSEDIYKNQWNYSLNQTFPFEKGDQFYGKDFYYVLANKRDLEPFSGIKCPANPGYGFSAYPGYETGLWGFPRVSYRNNCFPDPCIIQDSYTEEIILNDKYTDITFTIQDAINPECLGNI